MSGMSVSSLEIRQTAQKGRGVYTRAPIKKGEQILVFQGHLLTTARLTDDLLAMQIDHDLWLCSDGSLLDDCVNHSCEPNAGFLTGQAVLFSLRDIETEEEISWDYSTSISFPGWTMECHCGAATCRGIIRPWGELADADRARLRPYALRYLRNV